MFRFKFEICFLNIYVLFESNMSYFNKGAGLSQSIRSENFRVKKKIHEWNAVWISALFIQKINIFFINLLSYSAFLVILYILLYNLFVTSWGTNGSQPAIWPLYIIDNARHCIFRRKKNWRTGEQDHFWCSRLQKFVQNLHLTWLTECHSSK